MDQHALQRIPWTGADTGLMYTQGPSTERKIEPIAVGKLVVIFVFLGIIYSLGSALFYMIKDRGGTDRTAKALTFRIGLSVGLFALLFVLYALGIIEPHGLRP